MAITAVVLAGGPPDDVARTQPDAPNKAFVRVAGKALVTRTIEALRSSPSIGRIIAVAPERAHANPALAIADEFRPDGVKIRMSLRNGLTDLPPDDLVLVSASDLPILDAVCIDDFVTRARALDPDIGYGCIERSVHLARYPIVPHTWAHLREGTYCGGGFIAIKPRVLPQLERFIEALGAARKNPLRLAGLFGWDVLVRFALRRLSIRAAERRASQLLGAEVRAVVSPYPQTGVNVDRVSDIALAEELLRRLPALE
ncbi:MAG TPA: NTP transferase domain-containing protein [Candidatus Baltobacteraceae bacterium]|nr:NTP transferase domain-containing protein [Candidatus Baltobacteraceae bacterium]